MSSHTSLSDLCNSSGFIINISKQLTFETKKLAAWVMTLTLLAYVARYLMLVTYRYWLSVIVY